MSTRAEVRAELHTLRHEFMRTHRAVLSAEDDEIFEPGDEAHAAAVGARDERAVAYAAYTKARGKAKAKTQASMQQAGAQMQPVAPKNKVDSPAVKPKGRNRP